VVKGKTKRAAIAKATELWPDVDFKKSKRHRTPEIAFIDAAPIAEFGRLNSL